MLALAVAVTAPLHCQKHVSLSTDCSICPQKNAWHSQ